MNQPFETALPELDDNFVFYRLFPQHADTDMVDLLQQIQAHAYMLSQEYLWHHDPFHVRVYQSSLTLLELRGKSYVGDCIDDEWFIVYLLYAISQTFPVIISVQDNDGEFLLIEAAPYLPRWIRPENSSNRVFIFQGKLHLLPPAVKAVDQTLPIEEALKLVQDTPNSTQADDEIQHAIAERIQIYPSQITQHVFKTNVIVPRTIARLLVLDPSWIAAASTAFCHRDMISLRPCQAMHHFPPSTSVMTTVNMTRTLYAQLTTQPFYPTKAFRNDPEWSKLFALPKDSDERKMADVGLKLACGFEILMTDHLYRDKSKDGQQSAESYDFGRDKQWQQFLRLLQFRDYFRGEIEGSTLHKQLLQQAQQHYLVTKTSTEDVKGRPSLQTLLPLLLSQSNEEHGDDVAFDRYLAEHGYWQRHPVDESWMDITQTEMDKLIKERMASSNADPFDLSKTVDSFKSFLNQKSGAEGVQQEDEEEDTDAEKWEDESDSDKDVHDLDSYVKKMSKLFEKLEKRGYDPERGFSDHEESFSDGSEDEQSFSDAESQEGEFEDRKDDRFEDVHMRTYYEAMEQQLSGTHVTESFERASAQITEQDERGDDLKPKRKEGEKQGTCVDVNYNLAKNFLASVNAQQGASGPVSNIMGALGISVPRDEDDLNATTE